MEKAYARFEVKAASDSGEFEAIASMPTLDRDGEVIDAGAFEPLPETVPVHAYHAFSDPVGVGQPYYDGDVLRLRGTFASTPRAQEVRQLVLDGAVPAMSVGFITRNAEDVDGVRHITSAELLEVSFVSVPALREARVLAAKSADLELDPPACPTCKASDTAETSTPEPEAAAGEAAAEKAAAEPDAAEGNDGDEGTDLDELRVRALRLLVDTA